MKILWHCRSCNQEGEQKILLEEIAKEYNKGGKNVFEALESLIKHECKDRNIGIKIGESK